jgi:hypothetical protein
LGQIASFSSLAGRKAIFLLALIWIRAPVAEWLRRDLDPAIDGMMCWRRAHLLRIIITRSASCSGRVERSAVHAW